MLKLQVFEWFHSPRCLGQCIYGDYHQKIQLKSLESGASGLRFTHCAGARLFRSLLLGLGFAGAERWRCGRISSDNELFYHCVCLVLWILMTCDHCLIWHILHKYGNHELFFIPNLQCQLEADTFLEPPEPSLVQIRNLKAFRSSSIRVLFQFFFASLFEFLLGVHRASIHRSSFPATWISPGCAFAARLSSLLTVLALTHCCFERLNIKVRVHIGIVWIVGGGWQLATLF